MSFYCQNCGKLLPDGARFCDQCGARAEPAAPVQQTVVPGAKPKNYGKNAFHPELVGFSEVYRRPEILAFKAKKKKSGAGCMWFASFLPVIILGMLGIFGWMAGENGLDDALFLAGMGIIPTAIFLVISAIRRAASRREKPMWEGVVVNKTKKQERDYHAERHQSDGHTVYYTNYTIHVRTDDGQNKRFGQIDNNDLYSYFEIGDRVRYHPGLEYYEKYDKSHDNFLFCACCGRKNSIENDVCKECGMPLFK